MGQGAPELLTQYFSSSHAMNLKKGHHPKPVMGQSLPAFPKMGLKLIGVDLPHNPSLLPEVHVEI